MDAIDLTKVLRRRIFAFAVDFGLVSLLSTLIARSQFESFPSNPALWSDDQLTRLSELAGSFNREQVLGDTKYVIGLPGIMLTLAVVTVLCVIVFALLPASSGWSPGKKMFGLQVTTPAGGRPGLDQFLIRSFVGLVDLLPVVIPGLLGFLLARGHKPHQRLGDRLADTIVIDGRASATLAPTSADKATMAPPRLERPATVAASSNLDAAMNQQLAHQLAVAAPDPAPVLSPTPTPSISSTPVSSTPVSPAVDLPAPPVATPAADPTPSPTATPAPERAPLPAAAPAVAAPTPPVAQAPQAAPPSSEPVDFGDLRADGDELAEGEPTIDFAFAEDSDAPPGDRATLFSTSVAPSDGVAGSANRAFAAGLGNELGGAKLPPPPAHRVEATEWDRPRAEPAPVWSPADDLPSATIDVDAPLELDPSAPQAADSPTAATETAISQTPVSQTSGASAPEPLEDDVAQADDDDASGPRDPVWSDEWEAWLFWDEGDEQWLRHDIDNDQWIKID